MGRGRAKAKQVKVARQLKYKSDDTDLDRLRAELGVGADSLGYVSLDGLIAATEQPSGSLCRACFDCHYPVPIPDSDRGKSVLEPVASV